MNGLQGWFFLFLLLGLGARGLDASAKLQLALRDMAFVGVALALAILQRTFVDQVTLDEPVFAPLLLAIPTIAALRGGLRDGLMTAAATWIALTALAGSLPAVGRSELPQETFVVATVFALLIAGAAATVAAKHRTLGALCSLGWLGFFASRDPSLLKTASVWGTVLLAVGWTAIGSMLFTSPQQPTPHPQQPVPHPHQPTQALGASSPST